MIGYVERESLNCAESLGGLRSNGGTSLEGKSIGHASKSPPVIQETLKVENIHN